MKTANRGKIILAVLLALEMILPFPVAAAEGAAVENRILADDVEVCVFNPEEKEWEQDLKLTESRKLDGDLAAETGDYEPVLTIENAAFEVTGSVTATGEKDGSTYVTGVQAWSKKNPAGVTVGGEVAASAEAGGDGVWSSAEGLKTGAWEEMNVSVGGGVSASSHVTDGTEDGNNPEAAQASAVIVNANAGETSVEIGGTVRAEAAVPEGDAGATAVSVNYGVDEWSFREAGTVRVTVDGDATASAAVGNGKDSGERQTLGNAEARAVSSVAREGQTVDVAVEGKAAAAASNEAEHGGNAEAAALEAFADGEGSRIGYTVSGEITAEAKVTSDEAEAAAEAVRLEVSGGGAAALTAGGDITAAAEGKNSSAAAVVLENAGGTITAEVVGNVTASGDGYNVGAVVQSTSSNEEGTTEKGNSDLTVTGDVSADIGMELAIDEVQTANITVDGTIEGETAGIVLSADTKLSENITMTVWEVKPDKDGAVVVREEIKEDELAYTEDKEAEKLIQYIIKVEDASKDYIVTDGTKAFTAGNGNVYQVAHEGDKVLVKLNIPVGKELVDAFWDAAKSQAGRLLKDAEGNYYLEVPRGGGVLLSVTLKDAPKPEEKQESKSTAQPAEAKPYVEVPILKVRDLAGMAEIEFYRDKRFIVKPRYGVQERGTFRTEDGTIILKCADATETEFSFDMGEGMVEYITRDGTETHYIFQLKLVELAILRALK